jgi:hypothetical protein
MLFKIEEIKISEDKDPIYCAPFLISGLAELIYYLRAWGNSFVFKYDMNGQGPFLVKDIPSLEFSDPKMQTICHILIRIPEKKKGAIIRDKWPYIEHIGYKPREKTFAKILGLAGIYYGGNQAPKIRALQNCADYCARAQARWVEKIKRGENKLESGPQAQKAGI